MFSTLCAERGWSKNRFEALDKEKELVFVLAKEARFLLDKCTKLNAKLQHVSMVVSCTARSTKRTIELKAALISLRNELERSYGYLVNAEKCVQVTEAQLAVKDL